MHPVIDQFYFWIYIPQEVFSQVQKMAYVKMSTAILQ